MSNPANIMARRRRLLEDDVSDSSNDDDDDLDDFDENENPDVRAERELFRNPHKRKRNMTTMVTSRMRIMMIMGMGMMGRRAPVCRWWRRGMRRLVGLCSTAIGKRREDRRARLYLMRIET